MFSHTLQITAIWSWWEFMKWTRISSGFFSNVTKCFLWCLIRWLCWPFCRSNIVISHIIFYSFFYEQGHCRSWKCSYCLGNDVQLLARYHYQLFLNAFKHYLRYKLRFPSLKNKGISRSFQLSLVAEQDIRVRGCILHTWTLSLSPITI